MVAKEKAAQNPTTTCIKPRFAPTYLGEKESKGGFLKIGNPVFICGIVKNLIGTPESGAVVLLF